MTATTSRLSKGLYREHPFATGLFNLRHGQARTPWIAKGTGWYNRCGELLGGGDLANRDLMRIRSGLEAGEIFVILPEQARGADVPERGVDYMEQHAMYVITDQHIHVVAKDEGDGSFLADGVLFKNLRRDKVKELLAA